MKNDARILRVFERAFDSVRNFNGKGRACEKVMCIESTRPVWSKISNVLKRLGFLVNSGTTPGFAKLRSVELVGDELSVPGQQRIRLRDSRQFFQDFPSEPMVDLSLCLCCARGIAFLAASYRDSYLFEEENRRERRRSSDSRRRGRCDFCWDDLFFSWCDRTAAGNF
jgi:hypothetical protein